VGEPYIRIEGVSKRFGELAAVDNVSLDIERGEIFCLLGASGCGKTTLLRMLAGFEQTSGGRILIDGVDMAGVPPYHRPVNMMFQSYALFPHMTVEQNVGFGLKQEGIDREEIGQRVGDMLGIVKLRGLEHRKPHQLSGGQRQRVALARALIKRPKVLLLDEPLGALDKKLREHTQFELLNLQHRLGVTFVVVTHDQEEAMTLASRIGVMNHGRIVQVGSPREIYESPRTRFIAEFIGSVNTFEGRVAEQDSDRMVVESPELQVPLSIALNAGATRGATVWTAVRPEKMRVSREPPSSAYNHAQGVVTDVAYLGDTSTYLIQLESGKTLRTTEPNAERDSAGRLARDERVWVSWHESSCVVVTE
jgi:putrescine transport system ATP-binding protein